METTERAMETTGRTFDSWLKERNEKDGKSRDGGTLYRELVWRINVFTGREKWLKKQDRKHNRDKEPQWKIKISTSEHLEGVQKEWNRFPVISASEFEGEEVEEIVLDAEKEELIEQNYNNDKKNEKPYAELDDREKNIFRCDFVRRLIEKERSLDEYYFEIDGEPVAELKRQQEEKDLDEEKNELEHKLTEMTYIDPKDLEDECYRHDLQTNRLKEDKINNILKDGYKSDDIKAREKIGKELGKDINRLKEISNSPKKINEERKEFSCGKGKRFNNMPDCVIKLFDWLLDKVNRGGKASIDGSYSKYELEKNRWEILTPEDQKYLLELLPQIKEYPDLELSHEDIKNIEFKLTKPHSFKLKRIQELIEYIPKLPQEKAEQYSYILKKLDRLYNLSDKALKEIQRRTEEEGEESVRRMQSDIESAMYTKEQ